MEFNSKQHMVGGDMITKNLLIANLQEMVYPARRWYSRLPPWEVLS